MADQFDLIIIGGGILGLATALTVARQYPRVRPGVLEKEAGLAAHQTGHNSGVIHSGLYYKPGSLKARTCVRGGRLLTEFCEQHDIPYERCGKVVVATSADELPRLEELHRRAARHPRAERSLAGRHRLAGHRAIHCEAGRADVLVEGVTGSAVMGSRVFIGIGSNLGDRRAYYQQALDLLAALPRTAVGRRSALYESEPIGEAKRWYVNGVVELETALSPRQLLSRLQTIESALGRRRTVHTKKWAARTIDLDILLFGTRVVHEERLKIPHPEMHRRRFVLVPLSELAPWFVHPLLGSTVAQLLADLVDDKQVRRLPPTAGRGDA